MASDLPTSERKRKAAYTSPTRDRKRSRSRSQDVDRQNAFLNPSTPLRRCGCEIEFPHILRTTYGTLHTRSSACTHRVACGDSFKPIGQLFCDPSLLDINIHLAFSALLESEKRETDLIEPGLFDYQPFIDANMRSILVDWLAEVRIFLITQISLTHAIFTTAEL